MRRNNSVPPPTLEPFMAKPVKIVENEEKKSAAASTVPWWWMRNDKGRKSVSVTFASISFLVTTLVYLAAAFEKLGSVSFRPFDVGACVAYFLPALSLYFGRRLTEAKYSSTPETKSDQ